MCEGMALGDGGDLGVGQERRWHSESSGTAWFVNYCAKGTYQFFLAKAQSCKLRPDFSLPGTMVSLKKMVNENLAGMESDHQPEAFPFPQTHFMGTYLFLRGLGIQIRRSISVLNNSTQASLFLSWQQQYLQMLHIYLEVLHLSLCHPCAVHTYPSILSLPPSTWRTWKRRFQKRSPEPFLEEQNVSQKEEREGIFVSPS